MRVGRIEDLFAAGDKEGRKAFMPFVTACDPSGEATVEIVCALSAAGADMVELGVAYSDPIADGEVIQESYNRVLSAGTRVEDFFETVENIRRRCSIPIAGMVSYSIVWRRGILEFVERAAAAGVDALIVPDLPPEEAGELLDVARKNGLGIVFLATPNTPEHRLRSIVEASNPFIYYVSVVGITGARNELPVELADGVKAVKALTDKPVVVGFGVSNPETAAEVAEVADGVIVGSAIVRVIAAEAEHDPAQIARAVADFARPIADAVRKR